MTLHALSSNTITPSVQREHTPLDRAVHRMTSGLKLAHLYGQSAVIHSDPEAQAKADILKFTYQAKNIYIAQDLLNRQTGELFVGYGTLVEGLSSRVSPSYLTVAARRQRKRILTKVEGARQLVGQQWRFVTLTMPFLRADVATVLKIQTVALQNFKKNVSVWKRNVQGAFFAEEMVIGDATTVIQTHFHIHVHVLMLGKYIEQWRLGDLWTNCVENACRRFGVELVMTNLTTNRLITDIRSVSRYASREGKTMDDAVAELCKYTTKGSEYEKVPKREILEIEKALHNRRMIKSYGCFNEQKGTGKDASSRQSTSLDTKCTTDAIAQKPIKSRSESLWKIGAKMIRDGRCEQWLQWLAMEFDRRREFREAQLSFNQPYAQFQTLNNDRWRGVLSRPQKMVHSLADFKAQRTD